MVPDKFNMVDMEGIDLIESQGVAVPGLYEKLVESIAQCRYQCLYNWMFDGVTIPPTYVQMRLNDNDEIEINEGVTITNESVIHIHSLEIPIFPQLQSIEATENGTYTPEEGYYGFNEVKVEVIPPLQSIEVTENGTYTPEEGYYGFSEVEVDIQSGSLAPGAVIIPPYVKDYNIGYVYDQQWYYQSPDPAYKSDIYHIEYNGVTPRYFIIFSKSPRFRVLPLPVDPTTLNSSYNTNSYPRALYPDRSAFANFTNSLNYSEGYCGFVFKLDVANDIYVVVYKTSETNSGDSFMIEVTNM